MKSKSAFILFYFSFIFIAKGQEVLPTQYDRAEKLFQEQKYFDAITEYKRLLFFDSTKAFEYKANYKIGECYKAGAKFDDAIKYFSIAKEIASSDSEFFDSETQIIRSNILRRTTDRALQLLNELEKNEKFKNRIDEINYWQGWAFMFADDWYLAARTFAKINYNHELRILADQTEKAKVSVTFAKVISYILPGAGSIYTGNILSGLMSLAWNIVAGYWTVTAFIDNRAFDGLVVGELVWLRFYRGSIENGGRFAVEKNLEVANKSLKFLQNEYKGIKP